MRRLLRRDLTPQDHFRYTHKETGETTSAVSYTEWLEAIERHRAGNNLPPVTAAEAEHQLCQTLNPDECEWDEASRGDTASPSNVRLRWSDIVSGTRAYLSLAGRGFAGVNQEEADRRAAICVGCHLRVSPTGCGACSRLGDMIMGGLAGKTTKWKDEIDKKACAACRCGISSLVHFPMDLLDTHDSAELQGRLPEFCWRKKGGFNRTG